MLSCRTASIQQAVEIWIGEELDDVCYVSAYNKDVINVGDGYSYLRANVTLVVKTK
jgi:hypothetical protein